MVGRHPKPQAAIGMLVVFLLAADWPQILGPERNGISTETGLQFTWTPKGPPLLWQRDVGEGYSGPVVAGERVVLFHRVGDDEVVECLHAASGKPIWKFTYATQYQDDYGKGNGPRATPVIAGKTVVTLGADGWLHALEFESGKKLWARNILKDYRVPQSFFGVGSSPVAWKNLLLVNVGGKNAGIVAFALDSGKEVWKATSDGASYSSPVVAEVAGVPHGIFFTRAGALILDPVTGAVRYQQRWRARIEASVNAATPLVIGDRVFFSSSYDTGALMVKLSKTGAEKLWEAENLMSNHYNTCVAYKGHLYGFDGRQETGASLRCVDLNTRTVKWNTDRFGCGSIILADGHLLILTERGELVSALATPDAYREKSRARILDALPCRAEIALSDGRFFARDQRKLACWSLR